MSLKKRYLKSKPICKVTFRLPAEATDSAGKVSIAGEFNDWKPKKVHAMRRLKNGEYTLTLDLEKDKEYQFRYLIDNKRWENDWEADKYVKSPFGDQDNSVVIV